MFHEAIGGPVLVFGNLPVVLLGYLAPLAILVVFGIWGFRLGSKGPNGNPPGGGGSRGPKPVPPPGGRESDDQRPLVDVRTGCFPEPAAVEHDAPERERELVAPGR